MRCLEADGEAGRAGRAAVSTRVIQLEMAEDI